MGPSRYDDHAAWYDAYYRGDDHPEDCAICAAVADLDDGRAGMLVDVGCGGGAHRRPLAHPGRTVVGVDISLGQLRIAAPRLDGVVAADALCLPFPDRQVDALNLTFVDTDLDEPARLVREAARVLRPAGQLVLVGAHPCFNGPSFRRADDGRFIVEPTYLQTGWYADSPSFGDGIRRRVGFHHRTLSHVFNDVIAAGFKVRAVGEYGGDPPFILGIAASLDGVVEP